MPKLNPGWTLDMRLDGDQCAVTPIDPFGARCATSFLESDHHRIKSQVPLMCPRNAYVQYAGELFR